MTFRVMTHTLPNDKSALRRELKRRRRTLTAQQQKQAALALCQRLKQLPEIRRTKRISLYLPVNGEIDPTPLIPWLRQRRVAIYLPVAYGQKPLWHCRALPALCCPAPQPAARVGAGHTDRAVGGF